MLFSRFLDGPRGRLFSVGYRPQKGPTPDRWVLVVPPFFEELNKSRRTLSLLGKTLAERGLGWYSVDLYGTGDSVGDVRDAAWDGWLDDLTCARAWLLEQGAARVDVLALRGGALLTWDWLAANTFDVRRLILWQPVISGRQLVHQLLRLRLAADLMGRGSGDTAASLRERLAQDGSIEIAGYRLSAALVARIEGAALGAPGPQQVGAADWYQVIAAPGQTLPPAVHQCARSWSDAGIPTQVHAVESDSFWSTQEIVEGTALIAATMRHLDDPEASVGVS